MVHYTRSVLYECVAESQSQGGLGGVGIGQPVRFFFILPRRVVCASARSDASMADDSVKLKIHSLANRNGRLSRYLPLIII